MATMRRKNQRLHIINKIIFKILSRRVYLQTFERLETSKDFAGLRFREWPGNYDFCWYNNLKWKTKNREIVYPQNFLPIKYHGILLYHVKGSSRAFSGRGISHFFRRNIGNAGLRIAGNGMRYTHGTKNILMFLFGKREKYEMIAWCRDK